MYFCGNFTLILKVETNLHRLCRKIHPEHFNNNKKCFTSSTSFLQIWSKHRFYVKSVESVSKRERVRETFVMLYLSK